MVEGDARRITDDARLHALADAYESKYGEDWHFDVRDGTFHQGDIEALVHFIRALPSDERSRRATEGSGGASAGG